MDSQHSRSVTRMKAATDPAWTTGRIFELEAEVTRLRAALETIRLHAEGQVSQYARARESVLSVALQALASTGEQA